MIVHFAVSGAGAFNCRGMQKEFNGGEQGSVDFNFRRGVCTFQTIFQASIGARERFFVHPAFFSKICHIL